MPFLTKWKPLPLLPLLPLNEAGLRSVFHWIDSKLASPFPLSLPLLFHLASWTESKYVFAVPQYDSAAVLRPLPFAKRQPARRDVERDSHCLARFHVRNAPAHLNVQDGLRRQALVVFGRVRMLGELADLAQGKVTQLTGQFQSVGEAAVERLELTFRKLRDRWVERQRWTRMPLTKAHMPLLTESEPDGRNAESDGESLDRVQPRSYSAVLDAADYSSIDAGRDPDLSLAELVVYPQLAQSIRQAPPEWILYTRRH